MNTIDQRVTRGILGKDIAEKAKADAKNCKDMAIAFNEYANGDYKTDMDEGKRILNFKQTIGL